MFTIVFFHLVEGEQLIPGSNQGRWLRGCIESKKAKILLGKSNENVEGRGERRRRRPRLRLGEGEGLFVGKRP